MFQLAAVTRAFLQWGLVARLRFERRTDGGADIQIRFVEGDHGDPFPLDGPGNVLGHAFFPGTDSAGQIHLCAAESWALDPGPDQFDLFTVVLHEIGHALGLEHSPVEDAVMAAGYRAEGFVRLRPADVQAIRELYGTADALRRPRGFPKLGQLPPRPDLLAAGDPDSDGDGIPDTIEVFVLGTDPLVADTDGDGVQDGAEVLHGTHLLEADSDGDGLDDGQELFEFATDPLDSDSDNDGVSDGDEVAAGTDPLTPSQ